MKKQLMFLVSCLVMMLMAVSVDAQVTPAVKDATFNRGNAAPAGTLTPAQQMQYQNWQSQLPTPTNVYYSVIDPATGQVVSGSGNFAELNDSGLLESSYADMDWASLSTSDFNDMKNMLLNSGIANETNSEMVTTLKSLIDSGLLSGSDLTTAQANLDALVANLSSN